MTALDYGSVSEVLRLTTGEKIRRPVPTRDRFGRLHRDPRGEYDWLYGLSASERAHISRRYMSETGVDVDVVADAAGFDYVDDWATAFVAAVRSSRDRRARSLDVFDDEWGEMVCDDEDALLGPDEVAELLQVKRNTLTQWRHRGQLPAPYLVLSSVPIWRRGDVMAFAIDTGREVVTEDEQ